MLIVKSADSCRDPCCCCCLDCEWLFLRAEVRNPFVHFANALPLPLFLVSPSCVLSIEPHEEGGVDRDDSDSDVEVDVDVEDEDPECCKKRPSGGVDAALVGGVGLFEVGRGDGVAKRPMVVEDEGLLWLLMDRGRDTALVVAKVAWFDR